MHAILQWKLLEQPKCQNIVNNNEGQKGIIGPVWGWYRGGKRVNGDEYGQCTLYICMKTAKWNLL
jgi:hypothetical protein